MFLKKITLQGFKSFADRTEFEFGSGITAIVGPNGCGKSNISDAVRWVLGEQSARSLRGDVMADVIFAGSRSRKPAGFTEVQLTFDNRAAQLRIDREEVTVARVLYRSGQSEYRLNGKICRLKDIRELLLDTGVSVDAYSIIEQGRVDVLLQASPLERRELFEEAAGISRYRFRRAEAQRKLERTQANLLRVQDVVEELERRLRSVRLAAGKARSFQQYDGRLRELKARSSLAELHELSESRASLRRAIEAQTAVLSAERAALAQRDAELVEAERSRQQLEDAVQLAEAALLERQSALSALGERITQGERRVPALIELREHRVAQAADLAMRADRERERVGAGEAALAQAVQDECACAARVRDLEISRNEARQRAERARGDLETARLGAFDLARRCALLRNDHQNLMQQQARLTAQAERTRLRQSEVERELDAVRERWAGVAEELEVLAGRCAALASQERELDDAFQKLDGEARRLEAEIARDREARSGVESRLALLQDLDQRQEGVDEGTRAILAWREESAEMAELVIGLVADVLRIDDPRLALLQPILSSFENHVLVRDSAGFLAAMARRSPTAGPVRVVMMDRLMAAPTPVRYDHAPGFVARAADWVQTREEFRPLAEHLLGRTIVVDSLESALRLSREALAGHVFITLAGEAVSADGRLTLGAAALPAGLISRKAEIRQLAAERDDLDGRLQRSARRRLELEAEASDLQLQRSGLYEQLALTQRTEAEIRSTRVRLEEQQRRLERELRMLVDEGRGLARQQQEFAEHVRRLDAELQEAAGAQHALDARVQELETALADLEALAGEQDRALTAALVERGRAGEKRSALELALAELRDHVAESQRLRADAEQEALAAEQAIAAAEHELAEDRIRYAAEALACAQGREQVLGQRGELQALRLRLEEANAAARSHQLRIEAAESALHEHRLAERENEVRTENLVRRVQDELRLDLEQLHQGYVHEEQDWEAVRAEIEELKGKISRLGNVNLDAIAELDELTPRYEGLVAQRDDLVNARERLQALIAELDEESRTRFLRAFEEIRGHFQEMFRKLFGGGKADILLEDPARPLECGIEIYARPPGKELRAMSLLSGGEKTLTAVALLVGVFRSRPSPFAILDEVDAALDEANVGRFNDVLQEFLSQTQFVVITHSKRTMASADRLFGITMEEPGVSKRVSVRFDDRVSTPSVA